MKPDEREQLAAEFMDWFARSTGLSDLKQPPRRYLWTDAFAVCNYLELHRCTAAAHYRQMALDLVDQVHEVLGQHRPDDEREGWISGLSSSEGRARPTAGGLRIGKKLTERRPEEAFDEHLEWERDGQYYHYLTKWIHALRQVGAVTGDTAYCDWACELAKGMHMNFCHQPATGGRKRLYWKMSIDLDRPLVDTMGHHDPLDGLITFKEIGGANQDKQRCELDNETADLCDMCHGQNWATGDPLGLGGLLFDAYRLIQLGAYRTDDNAHGMLNDVVISAVSGLHYFVAQHQSAFNASERLAFRELGLSIGLHAVPRMAALVKTGSGPDADASLAEGLDHLMAYSDLADQIEAFWLDRENWRFPSWHGHEDINKVMLATSLLPGGFLELQSAPVDSGNTGPAPMHDGAI